MPAVHWSAAVTHASNKGAAEGTEDVVHQGRVHRLSLRLSADGGLQLLAQCQRPDLVDHEDGAQVGRSGGSLPSVPGWPPTAVGRRRNTSTPLTTPWCVASGVAPDARGSRGHALGARCLPSPTRRPSGGPGVGPGAGGWGCPAGPWSPGAWSRRPPNSSGPSAGAG